MWRCQLRKITRNDGDDAGKSGNENVFLKTSTAFWRGTMKNDALAAPISMFSNVF